MASENMQWEVTSAAHPNLGRFVADQAGVSYNQVKKWFESGRVFVDGTAQTKPSSALVVGSVVEVRDGQGRAARGVSPAEVVFEDAQVIVINKPCGISTVPYESRETNTALDSIRAYWRTSGGEHPSHPLFVVHRIDKATSGLVMFAKTKKAEIALGRLFRSHDIDRHYHCIVHGTPSNTTIESYIMRDRGDGLRGASLKGHKGGKRAVTHIEVIASGDKCSECKITLETGRTHQIRIHLSELGHPLVGDKVYTRDFYRTGRPILSAPRLLLHAASLGFAHPSSGEAMHFVCDEPQGYREQRRKFGLR